MIGLLQSGRGAGSGRLAPSVSRGLRAVSALTLAVRWCGPASAAAARGVERVGLRAPTDLVEWRVDPGRDEDGRASAGLDRATSSVPLDAGATGVGAAALALGLGVDASDPAPVVGALIAGVPTWLGGSGTVTGGSPGAPGTRGSPNESARFCGSTVTAPAGAAVASAQTASSDAAAHARVRGGRLDTVVTAVCV